MNKKQLAQKLAAHRFTVISAPSNNDDDVIQFKSKERQAKQRAKRREEAKDQRKNNTLASKLEGFAVRAA